MTRRPFFGPFSSRPRPRSVLLVPRGVRLVGSSPSRLARRTLSRLFPFGVKTLEFRRPWLGLGIDFELRLYHFSAFILLALAGFLVLNRPLLDGQDADLARIREYYAYVFLTAPLPTARPGRQFRPAALFWKGC